MNAPPLKDISVIAEKFKGATLILQAQCYAFDDQSWCYCYA